MRVEELEAVCQEALRGLLEREGRPLPAAVVLPLPSATRVTALEGFPDGDEDRHAALERFAAEVMRPANAPCYGLLAEGQTQEGLEVAVMVFGARGHTPRVAAAPLDGAELGAWTPPEELAPGALAFVAPLQAAADAADPDRAAGEPGPAWPLG